MYNLDENTNLTITDIKPLKDALTYKARDNFYYFMYRAFKTINPSTEFVYNWHLQLICDALKNVLPVKLLG